MDAVAIVLVALAILIVLQGTHGREQSAYCPSHDWKLYERDTEYTCIKVGDISTTWNNARKQCQMLNADLLQIWTNNKQYIIPGVPWLNPRASHWIGVRDWDEDETFEYVNGTKVDSESPGLGKWSSRPFSHDPKNPKFCVSLRPGSDGWQRERCNRSLAFLCEKDLSAFVPVEDDPTVCSDIDPNRFKCPCNTKDWTKFEEGNKYIKLNKVNKNFQNAQSLCHHLGVQGHILKVDDLATETFIKELSMNWRPHGLAYWMGLTKYSDGIWTWTDGVRLSSRAYTNWFGDQYAHSQAECAAVVWHYEPKWRPMFCRTKQYHICETVEPCSAHPSILVMVVGQSETLRTILEDTAVPLTHGRNVTIKCDTQGYLPAARGVTFTYAKLGVKETGKLHAVTTIPINMDSHLRLCVCELTLHNGELKQTRLTIDYRTRPRLVKESERNKTYNIEFGTRGVLAIQVYANPEPVLTRLVRNGLDLDPAEYSTEVKRVRNSLRYKMRIYITKFNEYQIGAYTVSIGNGVDEDLNCYFLLQDINPCDATRAHIRARGASHGLIFQVNNCKSRPCNEKGHSSSGEDASFVVLAILSTIIVTVQIILIVITCMILRICTILDEPLDDPKVEEVDDDDGEHNELNHMIEMPQDKKSIEMRRTTEKSLSLSAKKSTFIN